MVECMSKIHKLDKCTFAVAAMASVAHGFVEFALSQEVCRHVTLASAAAALLLRFDDAR